MSAYQPLQGGVRSAAVYQVGRPCSEAVRGKWCVAWSTESGGPWFWYYNTRREAHRAAQRIRKLHPLFGGGGPRR